MTTWIIIGIVVLVAAIAIAVVLMTQSSSPQPFGASTGGGGGGLWSSILGITGSAVSGAGGIIDQQTAQHGSDPVFQSSSTSTIT